MRPSHPGLGPLPPGAGLPVQAQFFPNRGQQIGKMNNFKYYPSLSGSETDVSTSTENLTQEELKMLRNMERQEPQGEETHQPVPHYGGYPQYQPPPPYSDRLAAQQLASNNARREALRLDAMIAASRQGPGLARPEDLYRVARLPSHPPAQVTGAVASVAGDMNLSRLAPSVYSHPSVQDPILKSPKTFYQDPQVIIPNRGFNISSSGAYFDTSAISSKQAADLQTQNDIIAKLTREMKMTGGLSGGSDVESSGSTSTLNNPSATAEKIASLALQAKLTTNSANMSGLSIKASQILEQNKLTESQLRDPPPYESPKKEESKAAKQQELRKPSLGKPDNLPLISCTESAANNPTENSTNLASPDAPHYTQEMVDIISGENRELKHQLDISKRKIMKLDTLEKEMMKIHEAYSALKEHSEKRELLEKSARAKLQSEVLNLTESNKDLKERHEAIMAQMMSGDTTNIPGLDGILRGEILRKDGLINQLVGQNKELMMAKDRQEIELTAQRETIQEHRTHIDVLDSALSNAQTNVLRLEEVKREMTKNLEQLQAASEKRELMEKKLRAKLEEELKILRHGQENGSSNMIENGENNDQLRQQLSSFEEKVIRLESERTQWEQRYLEESAMRQVAIDAASIPKDAKIAVLEKSSAESEKMIAEARSDKLKQTAEIQQTQKRMSDMEYQIQAMEKELTDRDSIIKILQKSAYHGKPGENVLSIPIQDSGSSSMMLHSKQLSHSPLTLGLGHHSPQLSTPASLSVTPRQQAAGPDFFGDISPARGPLGKLRGENKVKSSSPVHISRSATPSDILRGTVTTPTRELMAVNSRRDSAPSSVLSESFTGKTLINTSELYSGHHQPSQPVSLASSGTLPKMSFAPMKEELSRTLPSKGFQSLGERYSEVQHTKRGSSTSSPAKSNGERSASRSRDRGDQSNMSLDSSLTLLDDTVNSASGVWNRSSLLEALKQEKDNRPESYWRV